MGAQDPPASGKQPQSSYNEPSAFLSSGLTADEIPVALEVHNLMEGNGGSYYVAAASLIVSRLILLLRRKRTVDEISTQTISQDPSSTRADHFYYYANREFKHGSGLNGFATTVAEFIVSLSQPVPGLDVTIAIDRCVALVRNSKPNEKLLVGLCSIIQSRSNVKEEECEQGSISEQLALQGLLAFTLQSMVEDVKLSVENFHTFDFIWQDTLRHPVAKQSIIIQEGTDEAKKCSWMMSSTVALSDRLSVELSSHIQPSSDLNRLTNLKRRRTVLTAGCIVYLVQSSPQLKRKKQCQDEIASKRQAISDEKDLEDEAAVTLDKSGKTSPVVNQYPSGDDRIDLNAMEDELVHIVATTVNKRLPTLVEKVTETEIYQIKSYASKLLNSNVKATRFRCGQDFVNMNSNLQEWYREMLFMKPDPKSSVISVFKSFKYANETSLIVNPSNTIRDLPDSSNNVVSQKPRQVATAASKELPRSHVGPSGRSYVQLRATLDANSWIDTIVFGAIKQISPSEKLIAFFESGSQQFKDLVIPIINSSLRNAVNYYRNCNEIAAEDTNFKYLDNSFKLNEMGNFSTVNDKVEINSEIFARALLSFYFQALEAILEDELEKIETAHKFVLLESFHKALFSICHLCLESGGLFSSKNLVLDGSDVVGYTLRMMDCTGYEYLKVSEVFLQRLGSKSKLVDFPSLQLPLSTRDTLRDAEVRILECHLWKPVATTSTSMETRTMIDAIRKLQSTDNSNCIKNWPPSILKHTLDTEDRGPGIQNEDLSHQDPNNSSILFPAEYNFVTYLMQRFLHLTSRRIAHLCAWLQIPPQYPVSSQIWVTFREVLRNHIHLLFNRHIDPVILCTIYGVCKIMKLTPDKSFRDINEVYIDINRKRMSEAECKNIVHKINVGDGGHVGHIIVFFNDVFVPAMGTFLRKSSSMEASTKELKRLYSGQLEKTSEVNSKVDVGGSYIIKFTSKGSAISSLQYKLKAALPKTRALYKFGDSNAKVRARNFKFY